MQWAEHLVGDSLESRLAFETLLSDLSSRFINLSPGDVDPQITDALGRICPPLGIDAAFLWQWSLVDPDVITLTHHHLAQGGAESPEPLQQRQFPWYVEQIRSGRLVYFSSLDELPPEGAVDRESCRAMGICSNLTIPLAVGGEPPIGALGLNTLSEERHWPETVVKQLQLVAHVFANAIARRRHDLSLRESKERLSLAADSAEAGLWELDPETGDIWATDRTRKIFGFAPDEALSLERLQASVLPGDWHLVRDAIDQALRERDPVSAEYRVLRGDGRVRWISSRGQRHLAPGGTSQRVTGLSVDITERRQGEDAVRSYEARLAAGVELAGLGFYEVDYDEGGAFFDHRLRALLGVPPEQAGGLGLIEFWMQHVHPDDRPRVLELRDQLHDGRLERISVEYRFLHPVQGERWFHHVARVAHRDDAGRTNKSYGVLRDISERRQREEDLRRSLDEIARLKDRLQAESDYLKDEIRVIHSHGETTGKSSAIRKVLQLAEQVAPTGSLVLVRGETGTGKELVAQAIHRLSPRRGHLMIKVNCAALPSGLVESELFGREKGAYTGALTRQVGRFEVAGGSTLFLDEIGELSLDVQAKLLRVLETGEFERLGCSSTQKVDVRVIAATHRDLMEEVRRGRFREDLYYRVNVFPIRVPPLRERAEDIPLLVWTFLEEFSSRMGKKISRVPQRTMDALQRYRWPGNVRELRNVIERAAIVSSGDVLQVEVLDLGAAVEAPPTTMADTERAAIRRALEASGWRIKGPQGAAAQLGHKPSTLYGRMKKLGIRLPGREAEETA